MGRVLPVRLLMLELVSRETGAVREMNEHVMFCKPDNLNSELGVHT